MANPRRFARAELVVFAKNAAKGIADGRVSGFLPEQNVAYSTALLAEANALDDDEKMVFKLEAQLSAKIAEAQERRLRILKIITESKYAMRSVDSPDDEYEGLGYDPPADPRSRVKPKTPRGLSATGFSNGTNRLKWTGNNVSGRVLFLIEANAGEGWFMIGSTRKRSFAHTDVKPGQPYQYRVRAEATRGQVSSWSNTGSVYEAPKMPSKKRRSSKSVPVETSESDNGSSTADR
jgi:hypothetical protein